MSFAGSSLIRVRKKRMGRWLKIGCDLGLGDIAEADRIPFWIAVLVDDGGAHAFVEIMAAQNRRGCGEFPFEAGVQACRLPSKPQQAERDLKAERRLCRKYRKNLFGKRA